MCKNVILALKPKHGQDDAQHIFLRTISTQVYLQPHWLVYEGADLKLYAVLCFVELVVVLVKPRYPYLPK